MSCIKVYSNDAITLSVLPVWMSSGCTKEDKLTDFVMTFAKRKKLQRMSMNPGQRMLSIHYKKWLKILNAEFKKKL